MEKTKKILVITLLFLVYSFRFWQTTGCEQFTNFYFNPISVKINVESAVNLDKEISRNIARFYHNKVTVGIFEMAKAYALTFEPRFLLELLGPLGLLLAIFGTVVVFKKGNVAGIGHLLVILFVSLLAILPVNSKAIFYTLAVSRFSYTFWGIDYFLRGSKGYFLLIVLVLATFWYYSFSWQMPTICNEIFFN